MQALLAFEQAPPFAAPFRFFLTAPFFAMLAGLLLLVAGPEAMTSRWAPATLALTHLIALGFMLQTMLGAAIQILPVVAGANLARPLLLAKLVHLCITSGTLFLVAGFLGVLPGGFWLAGVLLALGILFFIVFAAGALRGVPAIGPTIAGLKLALAGLAGTLLLGGALAGSLAGYWPLSLIGLTNLHASWGLGAWGLALLSAVAYVVVPMFQLTPPYPPRFSRLFGLAIILAIAALSLAVFLELPDPLVGVLQGMVIALSALFAVITIRLQRRSRRSRPDVTHRLWRAAMLASLAACALWLIGRVMPVLLPALPPVLPLDSLSSLGDRLTLAFGALVFVGGFMSVIIGMLYKIVPFLTWLHLQHRGQGKVIAPNMKMVLAQAPMERQMYAHLAACAALFAATLLPQWFARPAGALLFIASALLLANLLSAARVYRRHLRVIEARLAEIAAKEKP